VNPYFLTGFVVLCVSLGIAILWANALSRAIAQRNTAQRRPLPTARILVEWRRDRLTFSDRANRKVSK
jgi:hypothetical protein